MDLIENGYKILFEVSPSPYGFENRSSTRLHCEFVNEAVSELLERGCIRETVNRPEFCNPLHVAVQSSGKLRLILDLSHLNKMLVKKSIKYEDLRTVLQIFQGDVFVFTFDLKSAYHHVDICEEHMKFLSFKWPSHAGEMKFYEFKVLPFGLSSAPYIFTKLMRQLIKFWRSKGFLLLLYLDDGIGGAHCKSQAEVLSCSIRQDIIASGFTINEEKSDWVPCQEVCFLGTILNFGTGMLYIPDRRIEKLKVSLESHNCSRFIQARSLASITGQIISMSCAVGNITRLLTRNCYSAIEKRSSWDERLLISPEIRQELSFWLNNIVSLNGKAMIAKSSTVGLVYSDASSSGFGGFSVQCGRECVAGSWTSEEMSGSSTLREILAVKYVLLSLVSKLAGSSVKWFTDNQNVPRILSCGSGKSHLQREALSIFQICCSHSISIEMEWIPRDLNDQADFLSRIYDADDWGLCCESFSCLDAIWGPHSIDRFANHLNYKLPRFNSRFWNPGSEDIDTFVVDWKGENNYVCPPISLIPRVIIHMSNCCACGTLIVPLWLSAPFWPMLTYDGVHFRDFVTDYMDIPTYKECFTAGFCNSVFGNEDLGFRVLALRVDFSMYLY